MDDINALTGLPGEGEGEVTPEGTPPETTEAPVSTAPEPYEEPILTAASGEEPPAGTVDTTPDPAAMQAEIDRLAEVKRKAEEDARYWRKEKARARADYFKGGDAGDGTPAPQKQPVNVGAAPRQEDFDDYDKYNEAKIAYEVKKAKAEWDRDAAERSQNEEYQAKMQGLQEKISEGFGKYDDFEEVAFDQTIPITPVITEILAESEMPADVAYYLGKNRAEAVKISRMTPTGAARAIARIELEIGKTPPSTTPPAKKTSGAPAPIKPVGSGNRVTKNPDDMTQAEFEQMRKEQGAKPF